jgi:hemerythrin
MIWKENYKIGVSLIDQQHKELFHRVTDFVETLRATGDWETKVDQVNRTLNFMKDYVTTHFRDEEAYQQKIGYPEMENHQKMHRDMVQYVSEISSQYEQAGYQEQMIQQFAGKLLAWLINHVAAEDQKIGNYVSGRDVAE